MVLLDVNILVYAFRRDSPGHVDFKQWLNDLTNGLEPFGVADVVLSAFVRITTHPKIFRDPSSATEAFHFVDELQQAPGFVRTNPLARHWEIFRHLCELTDARGSIVSDGYLAALAIETDSELVSADRGLGRWPGLKWRHPLDR
jgi:toxin-antitoxin system PIN domain toxin